MSFNDEEIKNLTNRINELESIIGITNESEGDLAVRIQNIVGRFNEIMNQPDIKDYISTYEKVEPFLEHNLGETLHHEQTNFNDKKNVIINSEKTVNEYLKQYQQLQELKTVMEQSNLEDLDRLNEQLLAAEVEYNSLARDAEILHTAVTDKIKHYTEMLSILNGKLLAYMDVLEKKKL